MKRFVLFAGEYYYPLGGMDDCMGKYSTLDEATSTCEGYDWAHILDTQTGIIVWTKE